MYHGEAISRPKGEEGNPLIPEEVGYSAAEALLDEVYKVLELILHCLSWG